MPGEEKKIISWSCRGIGNIVAGKTYSLVNEYSGLDYFLPYLAIFFPFFSQVARLQLFLFK